MRAYICNNCDKRSEDEFQNYLYVHTDHGRFQIEIGGIELTPRSPSRGRVYAHLCPECLIKLIANATTGAGKTWW